MPLLGLEPLLLGLVGAEGAASRPLAAVLAAAGLVGALQRGGVAPLPLAAALATVLVAATLGARRRPIFSVAGAAGLGGALMPLFAGQVSPIPLLSAAMSVAAGVGFHLLARAGERPAGSAGPERLLVLALISAAGLVGLRPLGLDLAYTVAATVALVALLVRPGGAALAPLAGLILAAAGDIPEVGVVDLALGAALAALGRPLGRRVAAFLFLVGDLFLAAGHLTGAGLLRQAVAAFLAAIVVALVPDRTWRRLRRRRPKVEPTPAPPDRRLRDVADVLREMAATVRADPEEEPFALHESLAAVEARVCRGCPHHRHCWHEGFFATFRTVRDLLTELPGKTEWRRDDLPAELLRICPRPDEVALAIGLTAQIGQLEEGERRRRRAETGLAAELLRTGAMLVERLTEGGEAAPPRNFTYVTGLAKLAKQGGVSGDSYLVREFEDGRLALLIADGAGVGPRAFVESSQVVAMVEKLLGLGVGRELVVRTVNTSAFRRSGDEVFTALDLAVIDLHGGELELTKVGGAPTFLRHGDEVEVLAGRSVPVGVFPEVHGEVFYRRLVAGDLLVMVSDGVADAAAHDWVGRLLAEIGRLDPQEVAERILDEAIGRIPRRADDMTVLATAVLLASEEEPPEIQAWVRRPTSGSPGVSGISMEHAGKTGQARGR